MSLKESVKEGIQHDTVERRLPGSAVVTIEQNNVLIVPHVFFQPAPVIPPDVQILAGEIGILEAELFAMYRTNRPAYDKLSNLRDYLRNNIEDRSPSLTIEEALAATDMQCRSLSVAYRYIANDLLTLEEGYDLSVEESNSLFQYEDEDMEIGINELRCNRAMQDCFCCRIL